MDYLVKLKIIRKTRRNKLKKREDKLKKVLIVEDDKTVALGLKYILIDLGYDVIDIVSTGQEA